MTEPILELAIARSDPANLVALGVVWWRLDRRLRQLRSEVEARDDPEG